MNALSVMPWIWLGITIVCLVFEATTFSLTTIWFALSGFVMIFLSIAKFPLVWQILIFIVISLLLLFFTRPVAVKKLVNRVPTNSDRLIGRTCVVLEKIPSLSKGTVKIDGVEWSAKTGDNSEVAEGTTVEIAEIQGATLVVKKI